MSADTASTESGPGFVAARCGPRGSIRGLSNGGCRSYATPPRPDGRRGERTRAMSLATHAPRKRGDTRTRMLISAAEVMRERGAAGVTIDEVLTRSGAPRGSVYYHFPHGRTQLLTEALLYAGDSIAAQVDDAVAKGGGYLTAKFVSFWERVLGDSDFAAG